MKYVGYLRGQISRVFFGSHFPFPSKWPKNPDLLSQLGKFALPWEKISQQTSILPLECRFLLVIGTSGFPIKRRNPRTCVLSYDHARSHMTMRACSKNSSTQSPMGNGSRENPFLVNLKFSQPSKNQPNGKWEMGDGKKIPANLAPQEPVNSCK